MLKESLECFRVKKWVQLLNSAMNLIPFKLVRQILYSLVSNSKIDSYMLVVLCSIPRLQAHKLRD